MTQYAGPLIPIQSSNSGNALKPIVFLSDIDGTLVTREISLLSIIRLAVQDFQSAGGLFSLCTGRSVISTQSIARELNTNLPCILYGGAALYDFEENRFLWMQPFINDEILGSIRMVYEKFPDISIQVLCDDHIYIVRRNQRLNLRGIAIENEGPIEKIESIRGNILKVVMCSDNRENLSACRIFFPENHAIFAFSSKNFVDIVPKGAGKAEAIHRLSELCGIPLSDFHAAGDGMTDLPMLKLAGFSYAPQNALEEVKKSVSLIVPSVLEGGISEALYKSKKIMEEKNLIRNQTMDKQLDSYCS